MASGVEALKVGGGKNVYDFVSAVYCVLREGRLDQTVEGQTRGTRQNQN